MNVRMILACTALLLVATCSQPPTAGQQSTAIKSPTAIQPPTAIPEFVGDEEYAVYRDLLLQNEEMWNIPAGTQNVVFFDRTFVRHNADDVRAILHGEVGVSEELIASYLAANKRSYPLEPRFDLGVPVMLVSQEAVADLIKGLDYAEQCYGAVQAIYPMPEYGGWFYISRVGFDARGKTALMYIEKSLCGGAGNFLVLENNSGAWKIVGWEIGLQSDMGLDSPADVSDEEYAVYDAVLSASREFSLGSGYQHVTVYDQTGLSERFTQEADDLVSALRQEMPGITEELVTNLIAANTEPYDLAPRFAFEVPVVLVSWQEYQALSSELEEQECFEVVRERFPHPEFQGWFRLSRVGFSRSTNQALVYFESYVCNGAGFIALMEKRNGIWSMAAHTLVWLS